MFAELSAIGQTVQQLTMTPALSPRPIVVLSRSDFSSEGDPGEFVEQTRAAWMEMQNEIAQLSSISAHRVVPNTRYNIQIDNPEAAIEAIREVVIAVRTNTPVNQ